MADPVIIVGGGMAGLTAAAYLSRTGHPVLLFEKEAKTGGLVNSFTHQGFVFDGGIRAIENSGIVFPMLRQLGIDIPMARNGVSIGIEESVIHLHNKESLQEYLQLLQSRFPEQADDVVRFGEAMHKIMQYMDILYGIDNPLFLDLTADKQYLFKTFLPWLMKYIFTIGKVGRLDLPVEDYLRKLSDNQSLIDMIAQHFFKSTPTFFALSYFSLYLDYQYPLGGTGALVDQMERFVLDHQGDIRCQTRIERIDLMKRQVFDQDGVSYPYEKLIWCADQKTLYQAIGIESIPEPRIRNIVTRRRAYLADKTGGDSILTLYATVDEDPSWFAGITQAHFFYTPRKDGLTSLPRPEPADLVVDGQPEDLQAAREWIRQYLQYTTYEISCPVLRDKRMAPAGKTGLIISTLFDYDLTRRIAEAGWYEALKAECAETMILVLNDSIFPGLRQKIMDTVVSTPLTLSRLTGNSDGAITGWAFTNSSIPAVHTMPKIARSIRTPLPDVYQAGQWTFSPSGLPISILTGKLAADRVLKDLKKRKKK